jgi:hypothetical protein
MHYFSTTALAQKGFKIEKKDGVIIVSNPKKPIPKNGLKKRIVFKEELSIGVIEGEENYMFGSRVEFNVDKEGNFYVSDFDNHRTQKYDPQGKYLLTIGRKGQGPGEFESLSRVQFNKESNFYIPDRISKRISFFNRSGKLLKEISVSLQFGDLSINSEGLILALNLERIHEESGVKSLEKLTLFDNRFNPIKILNESEREPFVIISGGDINDQIKIFANSISKNVFSPNISYLIDNDDLIYFGYPERYKINIFSPEGKCRKIISRNYDPISVSRKDKAIVLKSYNEDPYFISTFPEKIRGKILNAVKFPKYKPAYQFFTLMENGWLFIVVDSIENEYALIDLFDKEGRYIVQFKTDVPTSNLFFKNGKAYTVAEEEGFPFVKRYAIELQEYKNGKWAKSNIKLY